VNKKQQQQARPLRAKENRHRAFFLSKIRAPEVFDLS
jgi:hypothetical protein